jgi:hypothetical protein
MTCVRHDREAALGVKKEKLITLVSDPFDPIDRKLLDRKLPEFRQRFVPSAVRKLSAEHIPALQLPAQIASGRHL